MIVLLIFAFISGLVTILAPCIWPLLPIILSSSSTGGRGKPLGISVGIAISFAFFTLALSYLVRFLHLDPNLLRILAVVVIGFLGLSLIIPELSARLEAVVSKFSGKLNFANGQKNGFLGGLITGLALGIVWSPCAGPILATIATLAATSRVGGQIILITIIYVSGVAIPLFLLSKASNAFFSRAKIVNQYTGRIQQIFGVIMILTALAIFTNVDKSLEANLLNLFPSYSDALTAFENNPAVQRQLNQLKGNKNKAADMVGKPVGVTNNGSLPDLGPAPEFVGITKWLDVPGPITLKSLRGKVVLVDFWTYTCINCIRTLPYTTSWYNKYHSQGFTVIGVHTPEFEFEKNTQNVQNAIKQFGIAYPVAQDNNYGTWNAYNNQYWPAEYLIDGNGHIRETHFGEGNYAETEKNIQRLIAENGKNTDDKIVADKISEQTPTGQISPESYVGAKRMQFLYPNGSVNLGQAAFTAADNLPVNSFSFGGNWNIGDENSTAAAGATLTYHFVAKNVYLVMRPMNKSVSVKVYLDGKFIQTITVDLDKLYTLVQLKDVEEHVLKLEFVDGGVAAYAFTFG